ncbi:MAG: apolipoprotein N-acyltransferase [Pseudomonadota bacterium]
MSATAEIERAPTGKLRRTAAKLARLSGWRRLAVSALLGGLAALAFAPLYLVPLLWLAFPCLLWLLEGAKRDGEAFRIAWAFGSGHFLVGTYWVGIAFLVDAEQYAALMPVAVLAMGIGLGLFPAAAIYLVWRCRLRGAARALGLAGAWLAVEWLRSWVLTGFPWNLMGSVWAFSDSTIQLAALTGVWGLSLITVIAAALPATLAERDEGSTLRRWLPSLLGLVLIALVWGGGIMRLADAPAVDQEMVPDTVLRLVQPNVQQSLKWSPEWRRKNVIDQMTLSLGGQDADAVTHVVWAETATPYVLANEPQLRDALSRVVPADGLLLTGALRRKEGEGKTRLWNSMHALDGAGEIVGTYDKFHLVPFGEYVPLRWLFGFAKVTHGRVDFSAGPGLTTLDLPGLPPVGVLVCYEVIFPGQVTQPDQRPAWLLNITNDGWFGTSSGPYQHLASARLRAVEEGLPIVRVANSGITAVFDAYGRELARLGLNRSGAIDVPLPQPLPGLTPYARFGNAIVAVLLVLSAMGVLLLRLKQPL